MKSIVLFFLAIAGAIALPVVRWFFVLAMFLVVLEWATDRAVFSAVLTAWLIGGVLGGLIGVFAIPQSIGALHDGGRAYWAYVHKWAIAGALIAAIPTLANKLRKKARAGT